MRFTISGLVVTLALGLLASASAAQAQQPAKVPRVGVLSDESTALGPVPSGAVRDGLRELGYVEGQTIAVEYRYSEGRPDRLPGLAAELVGLKLDVIVAVGTPAALAAKGATRTIPIIFTRIGDPLAIGLVSNLARPGGNLTGVSLLTYELSAKRLELLKEAIPGVTRIGVLWNPTFPPAGLELKELEGRGAARSLGLQLHTAAARSPEEFEEALRAVARERVGAITVLTDQMFTDQRKRIANLVAKTRLPAMFVRSEMVEAGGLMSYGTSYADVHRRAAAYVDRVLKGANVGDLPVEQPTKFEFVINLKTAKSLGLKLPQSLLQRADRVIH